MEIFIFLRIVSFFASANLIYPSGSPTTFKIFLSLMISIIITGFIGYDSNIEINNTVIFYTYIINETVTGIILGTITNICFSMIRVIGSMIDHQMGLSMASILDPNSQSQSTLIENIVYWLAIMIFFNIDGHHMLIKSMIYTFEVIPIGKSILNYDIFYIVKIFIESFEIAFKFAVPVIFCLLIAEFIMGLISRSVPQLNIMVVGVPVKILLGLALFSMSLPIIVDAIVQLISAIPDMYESTISSAPIFYMLSSDKTEEATPKKKSEQRKKGNIPKSKEIPLAVTLVAITMTLPTLFIYGINELKRVLNYFLNIDFYMELTTNSIEKLMFNGIKSFLFIFLPIGLMILVLGVICNLAQVGILFTGEGLKPSFSKLNPINGFKNMFSPKNFVNLIKDIIIIIVLGNIGYSFYKDNYIELLKLGNVYTPTLIYTIRDLLYEILKKMCAPIVIIAALDYTYQKYSHKKGLRMSKQEIKEEHKQSEGDPQIKSRIKQKQKEIASRRMMQEVPNATVIINNPTHISVALKYEGGKNQVPIVVAKGADNVALKIRQIAKEYDIPMIENKPVARMIYKQVDLNEEIPENMYQAVAEILVAVYKIKNRYKYK